MSTFSRPTRPAPVAAPAPRRVPVAPAAHSAALPTSKVLFNFRDIPVHASERSTQLSGLLASGRIRAKLAIGAANDPLEREADRVADSIHRPSPPIKVSHRPAEILRQKSEAAAAAPAAIFGTGSGPSLESELQAAAAGGKPMDPKVQAFMESKLGTDLSAVKVHTGEQSAGLNRELNSRAFTHDNHIHFGAGQYNPESASGRGLLAHELTHVVQQGKSAAGSVVQRVTGDEETRQFKVPEDVQTNEEANKLANLFFFGKDIGATWQNEATKQAADFLPYRGKTVILHVSKKVAAATTDPTVTKAREDSKKALQALKGKERTSLQAEADKRFSARTGLQTGGKTPKEGEGDAHTHDQALLDVMHDKETLESLPPAIQALLGPPAAYKPADFQRLLTIAEKLKQFSEEDLAIFKLLTVRGTTNLDKFEQAVDLFLAKKEGIRAAYEAEQLKKAAPQGPGAAQGPAAAGPATDATGKDPSLQEVLDDNLKDVDATRFGAMSESERYDLAREKTTQLTIAQMKYMKDHPGQTAKDFAKGMNPIGTAGDTWKGIKGDWKEIKDDDANSWGRWAAGAGLGEKAAGWMMAVAGVLLVASYLTGVGEAATVAAAAGYLLAATLTLSAAESELRIKAASQAKTPEEFKTNVELAAAARTNLIIGAAMIVIAFALHFAAKWAFPKQLQQISASLKRLRNRVRSEIGLKTPLRELKPEIKTGMTSLKAELARTIESAKASSIAAAEDLRKMSTEQFADKLEKGDNGGYLDSTRATMDKKVSFRKLLKTPEGRAALEEIKARLVEVLKVDVPAELERMGHEYTGNIDELLKAVDDAKDHDALAAALDASGAPLSGEHMSIFIKEEQAKLTNRKLQEADGRAKADVAKEKAAADAKAAEEAKQKKAEKERLKQEKKAEEAAQEKVRADAHAKAFREASAKAAEESAAKEKARGERRDAREAQKAADKKATKEAKAKEKADARAEAEAAVKARDAAEASAKAEAAAKAIADAETRAKSDRDNKAAAVADRKAAADAEAKARADEEVKQAAAPAVVDSYSDYSSKNGISKGLEARLRAAGVDIPRVEQLKARLGDGQLAGEAALHEAQLANELKASGLLKGETPAQVSQWATAGGIVERVQRLLRYAAQGLYVNPELMQEFIKKLGSSKAPEDDIQQLDDALDRMDMKHKVSIEGLADVLDHTTEEAIQHKRISSGKRDSGLREHLRKTLEQLTGKSNPAEKPPPGYKTVSDLRIETPDNPQYNADGPELEAYLKAFKENNAKKAGNPKEPGAVALPGLTDTLTVRITNAKGTFVFKGPNFDLVK